MKETLEYLPPWLFTWLAPRIHNFCAFSSATYPRCARAVKGRQASNYTTNLLFPFCTRFKSQILGNLGGFRKLPQFIIPYLDFHADFQKSMKTQFNCCYCSLWRGLAVFTLFAKNWPKILFQLVNDNQWWFSSAPPSSSSPQSWFCPQVNPYHVACLSLGQGLLTTADMYHCLPNKDLVPPPLVERQGLKLHCITSTRGSCHCWKHVHSSRENICLLRITLQSSNTTWSRDVRLATICARLPGGARVRGGGGLWWPPVGS